MDAFGKAWKQHRVTKRLTLRTISEKLGLSIGYLSDIEQGRKGPPDLDVVRKFEQLVGINDHSLVTLASQLKTKIRQDFTYSLQTRPILSELMFRVQDLPDKEIDDIIADLDKRRNPEE
jgi:transcriptional regulator with XRE-family HTH domain